MRRLILTLTFALLLVTVAFPQQRRNPFYITNQAPLVAQPYIVLPLGAIKPKGMLLKMLELQRDGLTGHLDEFYPKIKDNNGWLGGSGDGWEETPYWLDGALPVAYLLNDKQLQDKVLKYVNWVIDNQRPSGYFGPLTKYERETGKPVETGAQVDDWWPKMVMLKVIQQYYSTTGDQRVIGFLTRYFKFQYQMLPSSPLGSWGQARGGENMAVVYWLYNITREKFLLDLAETLHRQTFDWTDILSGNALIGIKSANIHCVNLAMGIKEPVVYYQQHPDAKYINALKSGLETLKECHGFVNGMYGGDEGLHGNDPTQGSELCSAVEMMYSFENVLPITEDVFYADYLEKIAYNVLPTQSTDDYSRRQYFQQPNQVEIKKGGHNFFAVYDGAELVYGTTTGYTCCLDNMHQGWPKLVQNLWYATADNGIAALVYGPSEVTAKVAAGQEVTIAEETDYPFKENIRFLVQTTGKLKFPFHLRIPLWCKNPVISINGQEYKALQENNMVVISREWNSGDEVELRLPMEFRFSTWAEESMGIERGPLVYALKIKEEWREISEKPYTESYWEVQPKSPWNYALLKNEMDNNHLKVEIKDTVAINPWNLANAPITVKTKGIRLPIWQMERGSAGKIPASPHERETEGEVKEIELIPYGCTTLRISEFPLK